MDKARPQNIVIVLIGIIFLLVGALIRDWPLEKSLWMPLLVSLAAVFLGAGLLYFVSRALDGATREVCRLADSLRETGIIWLWASRIETIAERRVKYLRLLDKPELVDLMGFNLATEILNAEEIRERIARAINDRKARVRVLILEPDVEKSIMAQQRLNEPGEPKGDQAVLPRLLRDAERGLGDIYARLTDAGRRRFVKAIRFADESMIRCMIVRIDGQVFVGNYLTSTVGNETPGMQIRRQKGGLFAKYCAEFEVAWNNGRELTDEEQTRIAGA